MAKLVKVDIDKPVSSWIEKERFDGKIVDCLTLILRTRGCYWDKCLMCGYSQDSVKGVKAENLKNQFEYSLEKHSGSDYQIVKIFTSGSFFDQREIPEEFLDYFYQQISNVNKLIVESRPEFIDGEKLEKIPVKAEVGIGLETSSDFIREHCINKGFKFEDFKKSSSILKKEGIRVKAYLLLKPPFLSEKEAIEDIVKSAKDIAEHTDVISLNLMNIPSKTYVESIWRKGMYRPPWLWSAVEALKRVKEMGIEVLSDPVAAGKIRGPHNCGKCDVNVADAIRDFSLSQDDKDLNIYCECIDKWKKALDLENFSRIPLFG